MRAFENTANARIASTALAAGAHVEVTVAVPDVAVKLADSTYAPAADHATSAVCASEARNRKRDSNCEVKKNDLRSHRARNAHAP